jgi:hypothetical protein
MQQCAPQQLQAASAATDSSSQVTSCKTSYDKQPAGVRRDGSSKAGRASTKGVPQTMHQTPRSELLNAGGGGVADASHWGATSAIAIDGDYSRPMPLTSNDLVLSPVEEHARRCPDLGRCQKCLLVIRALFNNHAGCQPGLSMLDDFITLLCKQQYMPHTVHRRRQQSSERRTKGAGQFREPRAALLLLSLAVACWHHVVADGL